MPEKFNPREYEFYENLPEDGEFINSSWKVENKAEKIDIVPDEVKGISSGMIEQMWGSFYKGERSEEDRQRIIEEVKRIERERENKKKNELNEKYVNLSEDEKKEFSNAQKDAERILFECIRRVGSIGRDTSKIGKLLGDESFMLDKLINKYLNFKKINPDALFILDFDNDIDRSIYDNLLKRLSFDVLNNKERKKIRDLDIIEDTRKIPEAYNILKSKQEEQGICSRTEYSSCWDVVINPENYSDTSRSQDSQEKLKKDLEYLRGHLSGDILIDLGGGKGLTILNLARKCGVQTYVNVDRGDYKNKNYGVPKGDNEIQADKKVKDEIQKTENINKIYIEDDLLDFVTKLKDGVASFCINGIDDCIIGKQNHEYAEVLAKEIFRATRPGGIIFGNNSEVFNVFRKEIHKEEQTKKYKLNRYDKHVDFGYDSHIFEKSKAD